MVLSWTSIVLSSLSNLFLLKDLLLVTSNLVLVALLTRFFFVDVSRKSIFLKLSGATWFELFLLASKYF